ncbi:hypothetical protein GDO78_020512 [Eleutherodactylus coqui]|uniref:Sodefrin-like factor n=1 Tax=Eleutherodactylus coqui TaxID=57060 RepID=A0A8J6JTC0_ELECQ|nr:hypothetical protein GDO78_020512 [Eleutherodactylus coqui]
MCGTVYSQSLIAGIMTQSLLRACLPLSECDISGTMSIKQERFGVGISCCNSDNCTPGLLKPLTKSSNPNGVICPSCTTMESTWCDASDKIQCSEDENMCFFKTTEVPGELSTAERGCTTRSLCDLGSQSHNTGVSGPKVTFTCTSGDISTQ